MDEPEIRVSVWRGDHRGGAPVQYRAPRLAHQTVLDVVTWIQRNREPGLSYRFACRVGMCGSCAMMVNGAPRWTCRTHVKDVIGDANSNRELKLAPLRNLPVIKDLACDMSPFFDKWHRAQGVFAPRDDDARDHSDSFETKQRAEVDAAIECIHCAVCYAACDSVAWNPAYLGPAALNRAWSLHNDNRDGAQARRLRAVSGDGGCQCCHSQHNCAAYCPVQLNPARSIAGLKRAVAAAAVRGKL